MKKVYWIIAVVIVLIIAWLFIRFVIGGGEDSWIKDEKGIWVKHGMPSQTPDYVQEQKEAINSALDLYQQKKAQGMEFSSQCLGTVNGYAVDIVHVPRTNEDNDIENQCESFRTRQVNKFIELDANGAIVKVL